MRHTVRIINLAITFLSPITAFQFFKKKPQCNVLKWELMYTTDQWSGIFRYSSTLSLIQVSCWYLEAMACVRSGSNTGLSAVTCLSWSSVIKTIPVAILHFEQTVTALLINSCLDISTAPWSLLEETVIPISLLLLWSIWRNCAQKSSRHRIPLRGSHVDDSGSCTSFPEQEEGLLICVALDFRSWLLFRRKLFAISERTSSCHEVETSPLGLQFHK